MEYDVIALCVRFIHSLDRTLKAYYFCAVVVTGHRQTRQSAIESRNSKVRWSSTPLLEFILKYLHSPDSFTMQINLMYRISHISFTQLSLVAMKSVTAAISSCFLTVHAYISRSRHFHRLLNYMKVHLHLQLVNRGIFLL